MREEHFILNTSCPRRDAHFVRQRYQVMCNGRQSCSRRARPAAFTRGTTHVTLLFIYGLEDSEFDVRGIGEETHSHTQTYSHNVNTSTNKTKQKNYQQQRRNCNKKKYRSKKKNQCVRTFKLPTQNIVFISNSSKQNVRNVLFHFLHLLLYMRVYRTSIDFIINS